MNNLIARNNRIKDENIEFKFTNPLPVMSFLDANNIIENALKRFLITDKNDSKLVYQTMKTDFPDDEYPEFFWESASELSFRNFFTWGHYHDFGNNYIRNGAMGKRHIEIMTEALQYGLIKSDYLNKNVLDVGCWTGGDLIILAGLGADVTAIEEHPVAAKAAIKLAELLKINCNIISESLYSENSKFITNFDSIYCSGVVYHVSDPLLFFRILFTYLKVGGELFIETKSTNSDDNLCSYSGTMEKGWNWYAPNEVVLGRWMVDAGFDRDSIKIRRRENNRLIASAVKTKVCKLPEISGFSRPNSWLVNEL
jgi:2-polyprenyl-3-methyl-5-hydroxy-6-metoxy-1,4-benzoquinol methylase